MSNRLSRFIRRFLEPERIPILFLIGVILLELVGSALYDWFRGRVGGPLLVVALAVGIFLIILLAYVLYYLIKRILPWPRPQLRVDVPGGKMEPRRGLIALVSQGRLSHIPATAAIQYHYDANGKLEHCWLVASKKPEQEPQWETKPGQEPIQSSFRNAQELKGRYEAELATMEVEMVEEADNPEEVFRAVQDIYGRAAEVGLDEQDIVADFTGGTKSMTAGMVLACTSLNRDLEFMKPRRYLPDGRADPKAGSDPKFVDIGFFVEAPERYPL